MRCDDPKCIETHRHTQILSISGESNEKNENDEGGENERQLPYIPPIHRIVTPADVSTEPFIANQDQIIVIGTQGAKITLISGLEPYAATLHTLVLRSNLIASPSGVEKLVNLEKLELYDNCIENLLPEQISNLSLLKILDLSFNSIRTMEAVACCPLLEELYLAQNKLRTIEGISGLASLKILDLGANRIRSIESSGLGSLSSLRSLWLGKNKIESIGGPATIGNLPNLEKLDIQNNRLVQILPGEIPLHCVQELYLACNGITAVDGLCLTESCNQPSSKLQTLDLSRNPLISLEGISRFAASLEELWLTGVALGPGQEQLQPLSLLPNLTCIYLEHSPFAKSTPESEYKCILRSLAPSLMQIDALCM